MSIKENSSLKQCDLLSLHGLGTLFSYFLCKVKDLLNTERQSNFLASQIKTEEET